MKLFYAVITTNSHLIRREIRMDQAKNEEIDLFSVIKTIWEGKWKIVAIIAISLFLTVCLVVSFLAFSVFRIPGLAGCLYL
mgnify:CR=1 FL=1